MALINMNNYYNSKIDSINEKIISNEKVLNFNKELLREECDQKIKKYEKELKQSLYPLELALSNLDEEVNKRLPNLMLKYNVKYYWKQREAIQKMRVARDNGQSNHMEVLTSKLNDLYNEKIAEEAKVKEKIVGKLSKVIITDENSRNEKLLEYENLKKEIDLKLQEFITKTNQFFEDKCVELEFKTNSQNAKLQDKLVGLKAKTAILNDADKLEKDVLLKVDHLTMQFGGLKAVDDLSFDVKKGEVFGLIGPNGAGKTTVFNCITQFYTPTKGKIYFSDNNDSTILLNDIKVHDVVKKGIIRTFQNVEVIKEISVLDNLLIAAHTQYKSNMLDQFLHLPILKKEEMIMKKKAEEVLEFMGLSLYKDWLAFGLPYGVLKKIEIARTLMNNPKLIILDEPAAGLNDTETAELTKLIKRIQEKFECTILLVEHDMGLVMEICDRICAISFGKLLALGTPNEIQANKDVQAAYLGVEEE